MSQDVPSYKERKNGVYPAGAPEAKTPESADIIVHFLPEKQAVVCEFDPAEYKTWEMVLMVLEGAKNYARMKQQESMAINAQMQMQRQVEAHQLAQKIKLGH